MNCTKGVWKVGHYIVYSDTPSAEFQTLICNTDIGIVSEAEITANARLIVSAVNACQKVNPENPQAVAESIEAMRMTLRDALWVLKGGRVFINGEKDITISKTIEQIEDILSKTEEK